MTLELTLEPVPSAARTARDWVKQELLDRDSSPELADAAVLGVSELVTNAVLHVRSTIVVRIVEDDDRLRVEVYDDSPRPPQGHPVYVHDGQQIPSTVGRGLQIVDSISHSWGVSYEQVGKCVWFLPAPVERADLPPVDWPWDVEEHGGSSADDGGRVGVELLSLPVLLVVHYRDRFLDLHREMTLIALDKRRGADLARRLVEVAAPVQAAHLAPHGIQQQVETALSNGLDRIDVRVSLPRSLAPTVVELRALLERANEFCADEQLLTLAAGPQEVALRAWYLGELAGQLLGGTARPWTGSFEVSDLEPGV